MILKSALRKEHFVIEHALDVQAMWWTIYIGSGHLDLYSKTRVIREGAVKRCYMCHCHTSKIGVDVKALLDRGIKRY